MFVALWLLQWNGSSRASVPALIASSGPFAKAVLGVLMIMSVYSWAVIWNRSRLYGRVRRADRTFLAAFRRLPRQADFRLVCDQHPNSLLARVAMSGQKALDQQAASGSQAQVYDIAQRTMDRSANEEAAALERHVGFLATTGSVSPFIGLMGTVWGVMTSFLNIGAQGSASLVVVAPGIAEALIATAIGLVAAIPAVMAFNYFTRKVKVLSSEMESFSNDFLNITKRHFLR